MKPIVLITILFCFALGEEVTSPEKIVITSESKVEMYTALF